jgi:uroporphyrinogen decarboxylase
MVQSGADIIDLDWMVDMAAAVRQFGDQVSFCGNLDPVAMMLQSQSEQVYRATLACMRNAGLRSFSAGGCEIPDGTPYQNLHAQAQALQDLGSLQK